MHATQSLFTFKKHWYNNIRQITFIKSVLKYTAIYRTIKKKNSPIHINKNQSKVFQVQKIIKKLDPFTI